MLGENVDLVAGDFNGAAWQRDNCNNISIIEEASQCTIWPVLVCCCLCCRVSYAKPGMSMETVLDPGREIVQKSLLGGVDSHKRRLFRRTKSYRFPCATAQHWQH